MIYACLGLAPICWPTRALLEAADRARLARLREYARGRSNLRRHGRILPTASPDCSCFGQGCAFCED